MGRRRNNGFVWVKHGSGATATCDLGTYHVEITHRGVAVRFEGYGEVTGLGAYANVDRARARAEQHFREMTNYRRQLDRLTA